MFRFFAFRAEISVQSIYYLFGHCPACCNFRGAIPMPDQIYIRIENKNIGPLSMDELRQYPLAPETPVWFPGLQAWTRIGSVPELAALLVPVPPPFPDEIEPAESDVRPPEFQPAPEQEQPADEEPPEVSSHWYQNKMPLFIGAGLLLLIMLLIFLLNTDRPETIRKAGNPDTEQEADLDYNAQADRRAKEEERILIDAAAEEKARIEAQTAKNKLYRNNWQTYISVSRSSYNTGGLGGISGLQIGLVNKTEYVLASVVVAIDYLTVNGYHHKREYVTFENVAPRSQQALEAPASDRGTRVEYEIYSIYAPAFVFCYDVNLPRGLQTSEDPWKCNEQQNQIRNNY